MFAKPDLRSGRAAQQYPLVSPRSHGGGLPLPPTTCRCALFSTAMSAPPLDIAVLLFVRPRPTEPPRGHRNLSREFPTPPDEREVVPVAAGTPQAECETFDAVGLNVGPEFVCAPEAAENCPAGTHVDFVLNDSSGAKS